jgi:hypothetical protein
MLSSGVAVQDHMKAKRVYEMSSQAIGAAQGLVMTLGLLGALWLGVYQVAYAGQSVGKFTTLLVYWAQLQSMHIQIDLNPILTIGQAH